MTTGERQQSIELSGGTIPVWPADQSIGGPKDEPTLRRTRFQDTDAYHGALRDRILEMAKDPKYSGQYGRANGGTKLYMLREWNLPEADFIEERAMTLFRKVTGAPSAAVDASWANVYGYGDYIVPHSHTRAQGSVVYMLDEGEKSEEDPASGLFSIVDPRIASCCRVEKGVMSHALQPPMPAGTMIIFPGQVVHCVNPYTGRTPRITIAWNINVQPVPGDPFKDQGIQRA